MIVLRPASRFGCIDCSLSGGMNQLRQNLASRRRSFWLGNRSEFRVVRVADGAVGVGRGLVELIQRVVFLPVAGQVRFGDDGTANGGIRKYMRNYYLCQHIAGRAIFGGDPTASKYGFSPMMLRGPEASRTLTLLLRGRPLELVMQPFPLFPKFPDRSPLCGLSRMRAARYVEQPCISTRTRLAAGYISMKSDPHGPSIRVSISRSIRDRQRSFRARQ